MGWLNTFHFSFSPQSPSKYFVKEKYIGSYHEVDAQDCFQWYYRAFEKFKSKKYPGKYLKVAIIRRERYHSENYDDTEEGAFFGRIVDCTLPTLDFELEWYNKKFKSFHFVPGQIKLELPDGIIIPLLSDAIHIRKPDSYGEPYRINQSLSQEFLGICKRSLYPGRRIEISALRPYLRIEDGIALTYKLYEEDNLTSLAEDLVSEHKKRKAEADKNRVGTNIYIQEMRWTSDEIVKLWKETNVYMPMR